MNHRTRPALSASQRWSLVSLVCSLAGWAFIGPLADAGMNFMLWTWLWPVALGVAATGSAGLALRVTPGGRRTGPLVLLLLGGFTLLAAAFGFTNMVAMMNMM
jgi:hypothetical protein